MHFLQVIVILNKCDVVPAEIAIAWKHYLLKEYPELEVVIFTSYPKDEKTREALARGKQSRRRRKRAAAVGPAELWSVCQRLVGDDLDLTDWKVGFQDYQSLSLKHLRLTTLHSDAFFDVSQFETSK